MCAINCTHKLTFVCLHMRLQSHVSRNSVKNPYKDSNKIVKLQRKSNQKQNNPRMNSDQSKYQVPLLWENDPLPRKNWENPSF